MKYIKLSRTRTLPDAVSFFGNRINILPALRVSARFVASLQAVSPIETVQLPRHPSGYDL